jgi:hypothetical protein
MRRSSSTWAVGGDAGDNIVGVSIGAICRQRADLVLADTLNHLV